jgi:hypothetical protein
MKKYELTDESKTLPDGTIVCRIRALRDFEHIKNGMLGGWIEREANLSCEGTAWIYDDAKVFGDAKVYGNAWVSSDAQVYGNARVYGDAGVYDGAKVFGDTRVSGDTRIYGNAKVYGNAWVSGDTRIYGNAKVLGDTRIYGNAKVLGDTRIYGNAKELTERKPDDAQKDMISESLELIDNIIYEKFGAETLDSNLEISFLESHARYELLRRDYMSDDLSDSAYTNAMIAIASAAMTLIKHKIEGGGK